MGGVDIPDDIFFYTVKENGIISVPGKTFCNGRAEYAGTRYNSGGMIHECLPLYLLYDDSHEGKYSKKEENTRQLLKSPDNTQLLAIKATIELSE